jgi:uncharacterized protein
MKAERRYIKSEVRATDDTSPKIVGHGATFNVRSLDLGGFVEIIAPGAFDACLAAGPDIVGMWNHDDSQIPLGRTTSKTMNVAVDSVGLRYEIDPPDTQIARDLLVSIRRGDITASSFGFYALEDTWDIDRESDTLIRTVLKAEVFDCSPVIFPAYPDSDAGLRAQLRSQFAAAGEVRSMGIADAELRGRLADIRKQVAAGTQPSSDELLWRLDALQLLDAAELI